MLVLVALFGLAALRQTLVMIIGVSAPSYIALGAIVISQLTGADHWAFLPALAIIVILALVRDGRQPGCR
jgi:hypothetical protein